jgi:putative hydrolase of the HAD superfamily
MTDLILFDVGATLVDPHPSARELVLRVLRQHGFDLQPEDMEPAEAAAWKSVSSLMPFQRYGQEESSAFWDAFYRALLGSLGLPDAPALRAALYAEFQRLENWRLYPDVVPVLETLRGLGSRLGVVSNWEEWLEDLLLALGVHKLFEVIIASGPFGRAKPHPSVFSRALELTGAEPSQTVHVGDSLREDVEGARSAGIRPILLDRHNRYPSLEVERISSLWELPGLL